MLVDAQSLKGLIVFLMATLRFFIELLSISTILYALLILPFQGRMLAVGVCRGQFALLITHGY